MDQKKKIDAWLEKIYGKGKIPSYETTPECLSQLENLMELSEQEEHGLPSPVTSPSDEQAVALVGF